MGPVRENSAEDKGTELKDISVHKYTRKKEEEIRTKQKKIQTPEGTEREIKSITGHAFRKNNRRKEQFRN